MCRQRRDGDRAFVRTTCVTLAFENIWLLYLVVYIPVRKHDFDVHEWAAPEFLELAAKELIKERWKLRTEAKLPAMTTTRLG